MKKNIAYSLIALLGILFAGCTPATYLNGMSWGITGHGLEGTTLGGGPELGASREIINKYYAERSLLQARIDACHGNKNCLSDQELVKDVLVFNDKWENHEGGNSSLGNALDECNKRFSHEAMTKDQCIAYLQGNNSVAMDVVGKYDSTSRTIIEYNFNECAKLGMNTTSYEKCQGFLHNYDAAVAGRSKK